MLPELKIIIEAVTAPAVKAIEKLKGTMDGLRRVTDSIGRGMIAFGDKAKSAGKKLSWLSAGAAVVGAAAFRMAQGTADAANAVDKSSKAIGLSASAYQELSFAIGQVSDMTEDQFTNAMRQMQTRLGQAADGSKAMVEAFEAIGVSQQDIIDGNVGTEEAFNAFINAAQNAKTPAEAMALAASIMGEEAAKLGPIMRESGGDIDALRERAQELGIVLGDDVVASGAKFTDKMDELQRQMTALKDQIGAALLPVLADTLIPAIQEKVIPALASFIEKVGEVIQWFSDLPGPVQEAAGVIAAALGVGGPILLAVGALSTAIGTLIAATGPIGLFIAAAAVLTAAWVKWGDDIKAAVSGAIDWVRQSLQEWLDWIATIPDMLLQIGQDMIQGLLDGIRAKWEELKALIYSVGDLMPEWLRTRLQTHSPSKVFQSIGHDVGDGLIVGIEDMVPAVEAAVDKLATTATTAAEKTSEIADIFSSNIMSEFEAIATGTKSVSDAFKDMVNNILQDMARMILQKNIFGPMSEALSDIFGGTFGGTLGGSSTVSTATVPTSTFAPTAPIATGSIAPNITINNSVADTAAVSVASNPTGDLTVMVDRAVATSITTGGATYKAMRDTFGVTPTITQRA